MSREFYERCVAAALQGVLNVYSGGDDAGAAAIADQARRVAVECVRQRDGQFPDSSAQDEWNGILAGWMELLTGPDWPNERPVLDLGSRVVRVGDLRRLKEAINGHA